jgi:hypothetical protein
MAFVVKDRVKVTSTTTGTGTFTLGSAVEGFQDFSVIGDGNSTFYTITDGVDFEVGIGTFTSSGTTLSRDTILESSNSGSAVNWAAGEKDVFVTYPAEKSVYAGGPGATFTNVSAIGTNTNAESGTLYVLTADLTLTLPATPTVGNLVGVVNLSGTITPIVARNGEDIMNLAEDLTVDVIDANFTLTYSGATYGWVLS